MKRYAKAGVGKKVGKTVWFHEQYLGDFIETCGYIEMPERDVRRLADEHGFKFTLCRLKLDALVLTLLDVPHFDTDNEPELYGTFDIKNKKVKVFKTNRQIYHRKELMVRSVGYHGFNIDKAECRTKIWHSVAPNDTSFYLKIGRKIYWKEWLNSVGIES